MRAKPLFLLVLLIIILFGLVLNELSSDSLWMDEGYSAWLVRDEQRAPESPRELLSYVRDSFVRSFERLRLDVHPPLYYLLLDGWTLLLGNSVFALRLLSALLGLLALAGTYALGANAFNRRAGLMALLLLGTSGFFVYYSREARSYALYLALATLSSLAYWRFWRKPKWLNTGLYSFLGIALLYTHYTAIAFIIAQNLFGIVAFFSIPMSKRLANTGKLALALYLMGVAFGAWWVLFGAEQFRVNTSIEAAGALASDWNTVAALWLLLTSGIWGWFALILLFSRLNPLSRIWGAKPEIQHPFKPLLFLLVLGIVPPILLLLVNAYGLAIFQQRYLIAIVPVWALLVAYVLSELWIPFLKNQRITMLASLIILLALCHYQLSNFRNFWPHKPRWSEASLLASSARQALEPALVYLDERSPFAYYAYQDGLLNGLSVRISWRQFAPEEIASIGEQFANAASTWAFVAMQAPESWDAVAALSANRGVTYRDAVQWTIYYRFDEASTESLSFNFGQLLRYENPFYQQFSAEAGTKLCVPIALEAVEAVPENYSLGLYLTRGYNEVLSQVDEGLGALAAGERFERELCLDVPEAGSFHLRLMIYDWREPLQRLPVFEHDLLWGEYLMLGLVTVASPAAN